MTGGEAGRIMSPKEAVLTGTPENACLRSSPAWADVSYGHCVNAGGPAPCATTADPSRNGIRSRTTSAFRREFRASSRKKRERKERILLYCIGRGKGLHLDCFAAGAALERPAKACRLNRVDGTQSRAAKASLRTASERSSGARVQVSVAMSVRPADSCFEFVGMRAPSESVYRYMSASRIWAATGRASLANAGMLANRRHIWLRPKIAMSYDLYTYFHRSCVDMLP